MTHKERVFSLYMGGRVFYDNGCEGVLRAIDIESHKVTVLYENDPLMHVYPIDRVSLILTPFEDITDTHAIELAFIQASILKECAKEIKVYRNVKEPIAVIGWMGQNPIKVAMGTWQLNVFSIDRLRELGYATPCHGVTDLFAEGIASKPVKK